ncbi:unnamed protein product [Protopolystoma xenopodis]|uniref:Uncharacterized protein n=1 Tax=Protopolystoma xenopodis TaxID=117903 RepID=A0A448WWF4_9PLAT|nr:unnamed protein product [Protopolystoma xenopodis]
MNTTTKEILPPTGPKVLYEVQHGWEFRDAVGRPVDSSLLAIGVSQMPDGQLRLSGLTAPRSGASLPIKVRCTAEVVLRDRPSKAEAGESEDRSSAVSGLWVGRQRRRRIFMSDFFALIVTKEDGSTTGDTLTGPDSPDIPGNRIKVMVEGLRPDGSLSTQPGESMTLKCLAIGMPSTIFVKLFSA